MQVQLLTTTAIPPIRATDGAAGYDLFSIEDKTIPAGESRAVSTGIAVAIPPGFCGQVWSRSGLAFKYAIEKGAGLIDSDYRGEIQVLLRNHTPVPNKGPIPEVQIKKGDRIAQIVIIPITLPKIHIVGELPSTERGEGGFGSTGQ